MSPINSALHFPTPFLFHLTKAATKPEGQICPLAIVGNGTSVTPPRESWVNAPTLAYSSTPQAAAYGSDTGELRQQAVQAGHDVAVQYRELLQLVMHVLNKPTMEAKQNLPTVSRKIAQCVTVLAQTAELLKGADWVDPDDPMLIAENELLGAAQSIEKAARKLASLKPRREQGASNVSIDTSPLLMSKPVVRPPVAPPVCIA